MLWGKTLLRRQLTSYIAFSLLPEGNIGGSLEILRFCNCTTSRFHWFRYEKNRICTSFFHCLHKRGSFWAHLFPFDLFCGIFLIYFVFFVLVYLLFFTLFCSFCLCFALFCSISLFFSLFLLFFRSFSLFIDLFSPLALLRSDLFCR